MNTAMIGKIFARCREMDLKNNPNQEIPTNQEKMQTKHKCSTETTKTSQPSKQNCSPSPSVSSATITDKSGNKNSRYQNLTFRPLHAKPKASAIHRKQYPRIIPKPIQKLSTNNGLKQRFTTPVRQFATRKTHNKDD